MDPIPGSLKVREAFFKYRLVSRPLLMNKIQISLSDGNNIIFTQDDLSWPKNFKTNLDASSYGHKPGQIYNDHHYTLETILLFLKNPSEKHNAYCQRAKAAGVQIVRPTHKKAVLNLLTSGGRSSY